MAVENMGSLTIVCRIPLEFGVKLPRSPVICVLLPCCERCCAICEKRGTWRAISELLILAMCQRAVYGNMATGFWTTIRGRTIVNELGILDVGDAVGSDHILRSSAPQDSSLHDHRPKLCVFLL
jgi:hypothetical protein